MQKEISVKVERTPNPQAKKFTFNVELTKTPIEFTDALSAEQSPLATKIFGFPWTTSVYIANNFVSITKQDWVEWDVLEEPLSQILLEHIKSDEPVMLSKPVGVSEDQKVTSSVLETDTEEVKKIKTVIDRDIRPLVAMDGGDIVFNKYEDHVVYIHMKGACVGCPSSQATLKQGVERLLKQALPEIQGVAAL